MTREQHIAEPISGSSWMNHVKYSKYISFMIPVFFLFTQSCQREEPTTWDVHVVAPLVRGHLTLDDLIPDSLLEASPDGLWHLVYRDNLTDFNLDSIVAIPDTSIRKGFANPLNGGPWPIPPGQEIISKTEENKLALNQVELREVQTSSGILEYVVTSYTNAFLTCTYSLPGLTLNGVPTIIETNTAPGSPFLPFETSGYINLTGYRLDLTGESGFETNRILSTISVAIADDSPGNAMIFGQDSVSIELHFIEPRVSYARGYFGQHQYDLDEEVDFGGDLNLPEGSFSIETVDLSMKVENNVGVDAQIQFSSLHSISSQNDIVLNGPGIYDLMNISRAEELNGVITPDVVEFYFDEENSNVDLFIENLPQSLLIQGQVDINPLGDVSAGNDFIYTDHALNTWIDLDIPLFVGMEGLKLRDTLEITSDLAIKANGALFIDLTNTFPFQATVALQLLDSAGNVITPLLADAFMPAAVEMAQGLTIQASETWTIYLTQEEIDAMKVGSKLSFQAVFDTPQVPAKLYEPYALDFLIRTQAQAELSIQ